MTFKTIQLKTILKTTMITSFIFASLFLFTQKVNAQVLNLVWDDVILYYPLKDSCDSYNNKGNNLSLRNPGGDYATEWVTDIFGGGLKMKGSGDTNTSKTGACYGDTGLELKEEMMDDKVTIVFYLYEPINPNHLTQVWTFNDDYFGVVITSDGKIRYQFKHASGGGWTEGTTSQSHINFENNELVQIAIRHEFGTWDEKIFVNGEEKTMGGSSAVNVPTGLLDNLVIGSSDTTYGSWKYGYNGTIGEFIVFNKFLSSDDLNDLAEKSLSEWLDNSGGGGSTPPPVADNYITMTSSSLSAPFGSPIKAFFNYDVCDWASENSYPTNQFTVNVRLDDDDSLLNYKWLSSCSGSDTITFLPPAEFEGLIYLDISAPEVESQVVYSPSNWAYNYFVAYSDEWYLRTPEYIYNFNADLNNETYDIPLVYNLDTVLDWEEADYYICMMNYTHNITATPFCTDVLANSSGALMITATTLPHTLNEYIFGVFDDEDDSLVFQGVDSFIVIIDSFSEGYIWQPQAINQYPPFLRGLIDWKVPLTNFRPFSILDSTFKTVDRLLRDIFPFGTALMFRQAYVDSEGYDLSQAQVLTFFHNVIDEQGVLFFNIPSAWANSEISHKFIVYNPTNITDNEDVSVFWATFRELTKYGFIFLFMYLLFAKSKTLIKELTG